MACLTHAYSPAAKVGTVAVQLLRVPPVTAPVAKVYVNVPLNAAGAEELLVLLRYKDTGAPLAPAAPLSPLDENNCAEVQSPASTVSVDPVPLATAAQKYKSAEPVGIIEVQLLPRSEELKEPLPKDQVRVVLGLLPGLLLAL